MKILIAAAVYASAMTFANLSIAHWGVWVSPINAFILIGLDFSLRDWLHEKIKPLEMFCLILISGAITYILNPGAGMIAIASAVSFTAAAFVDWGVFQKLDGSWAKKANLSNIAGAAVDSLLFPTIAFGSLMPKIVVMQFLAKIIGGAIWAFLLGKVK
jgi:hypothetical protein